MNKKRFDAVKYGHTTLYRENGVNIWRNKVHVRLNELYDENQKLNELCVQYGFEMGRLEEENEELKSEIKKVKREYTQLWMRTYK